MIQDWPKEFLRQFGRPYFVGMRQAVSTWRSRTTQSGDRSGVETQGVTNIVQSDRSRKLSVYHGNDVTPGTENPSSMISTGFPSQLGNETSRKEVADLAKNCEFGTGWF
jgi:hypothetical protein